MESFGKVAMDFSVFPTLRKKLKEWHKNLRICFPTMKDNYDITQVTTKHLVLICEIKAIFLEKKKSNISVEYMYYVSQLLNSLGY